MGAVVARAELKITVWCISISFEKNKGVRHLFWVCLWVSRWIVAAISQPLCLSSRFYPWACFVSNRSRSIRDHDLKSPPPHQRVLANAWATPPARHSRRQLSPRPSLSTDCSTANRHFARQFPPWPDSTPHNASA